MAKAAVFGEPGGLARTGLSTTVSMWVSRLVSHRRTRTERVDAGVADELEQDRLEVKYVVGYSVTVVIVVTHIPIHFPEVAG